MHLLKMLVIEGSFLLEATLSKCILYRNHKARARINVFEPKWLRWELGQGMDGFIRTPQTLAARGFYIFLSVSILGPIQADLFKSYIGFRPYYHGIYVRMHQPTLDR